MALALAVSNVLAQSDAKTYTLQDFSGGLNTRVNSVLLQDNESPSLQNVVLDRTYGISKREGSTKLNSSAIGGGSSDVQAVYQLEQSDGDRYCVAFSSTNGYYSTDGCQSFTSFVSTLTRNNDVNCDAFQDRLYCVNDQYNFYFDGANDITFTAVADLEFIKTHRSRCFAAGKDANPSRLYWSNLADCATWTTATDWVDISPEDGDVITGIGPPIFDMLPIYKKFSTWVLRGASGSPDTWALVNVSKTTGARNHRSISNFNNVQLFDSAGPNGGQSGIYGFDGITIKEYSEKVRGELDQASQFQSNTGRKTIDSKSDWDAGTFDSMALSSARAPGLMQSSYTAYTDTLGTDFANGTLTKVSTTTTSNSLTLLQIFPNAGAESSDTSGWYQTSYTNTVGSSMYGSRLWDDTRSCACPLTFVVRITNEDSTNSLLWATQSITDGMSATSFTVDTSTLTQTNIRLVAYTIGCSINPSAISNTFARGDTINVKVADSVGAGVCGSRFDINEGPMVSSGNIVSQTFDTAISTPIWGLFQATFSSSSAGALSFQTQVATSAFGTWDSLVTATNGSEITSASKRYVRYKASFSVGATTDTSATLSDVSITAASTGVWTSSELFLSNQLTAWGLFQCDQTTSGGEASIAYAIRTSTYSGGTASATYATATCGSAITNSTGPYVQINSTYTVGVATETAQTDNIVLNWTEGTSARAASATVFRNRYHYGAQSKTGTYNDTIYVLDGRGAWSKWTGLRPRFLGVVSQKLVLGDSIESTGGFVRELYRTDSDDGSGISAWWESKDLTLGPIQNVKAVDRLYLIHASSATTLTVQLKADTGLRSNTYTINLSTGAAFGVVNKSMTVPLNGNSFRFKFSDTGASTPWEILGFGMAYRDLGLKQP